MFKKLNPLFDRLLQGARGQLDTMHSPSQQWVWRARLMVVVFGIGFVATLVLILAFIGLSAILPKHGAKTADAKAPVQPAYNQPRFVPATPEDSAGESVETPTTAVTPATADASPLASAPNQPPAVDSAPGGTSVAPEQADTAARPVDPAPDIQRVDSSSGPSATEPATGSPTGGAPTVATPEEAPSPRQVGKTPDNHPNPVVFAPTRIGFDSQPAPVSAPSSSSPLHPRLFVDGVDSGITVTMRKGVAYVPVDPVALRLGLGIMIEPLSNDVRVDGQRVPGPVIPGKDHVLVQVNNLAPVIGRVVELDKAHGIISLKKAPARAAAPSPAAPLAASTPPEVIPDRLPETSVPVINQGSAPIPEAFRPVIESNGSMEISVTKIETSHDFRGLYHAADSNHYVIVFVSLSNVTNEYQTNTGRFELKDGVGSSYEPLDDLSTLQLSVLKPGGMNLGYMVFEVPNEATPEALTYTQDQRQPITLSLQDNLPR